MPDINTGQEDSTPEVEETEPMWICPECGAECDEAQDRRELDCGCRVYECCPTERCRNCGDECCESCYDDYHDHECCDCGETYCGSDHECPKDSPEWGCLGEVYDHCDKPDYYPNHYEKTEYGSPTYGLEFEMNGDVDRATQTLRSNPIGDRSYWCEDGSIGRGAELVIAPHGKEALRKVNWLKLLKELRSSGIRAYQSGRCGLHIHVSRPVRNERRTLRRLKSWFVANRQWLERFSKRGGDLHWCQIPDTVGSSWWDTDKYTAINTLHKHTWEFRIFRGTTAYPRFRASIDFVEAIVEFCQQHSLATCQNGHGLSTFKEFIHTSNRWGVLNKYLKTQGL